MLLYELSGNQNPWSQITITNKKVMKKFEILWELPKHDWDKKWASAIGKLALIKLA